MTQTVAKPQRDESPELPESFEPIEDSGRARERLIARLELLWAERRFVFRTTAVGLLSATLLVFLIPKSYESTVRLMPPDSQAGAGPALVGALANNPGIDLGTMVSGLMGLKSTGAQFVGILRSRTVQDRIVDEFNLRSVYGKRLKEDACDKLGRETDVSEDRKSGIISIAVSDRDPKRAAAMAGAYVDELNRLVSELTTSSAHRERIFLEERLNAVKQDLDSAEKDFSQFASKNGTIDITEQAKVMVGAAATLEGELIASQSQLEALKQIYTANNVRVRSIQARITELRNQLRKLDGTPNNDALNTGSERAANSAYPTLRQLPLLGVPYADKFRRLKVEGVIFETLTKEYELAKVQEAKEIPTVRVLDRPEVPEKKSFPPRLVVMFAGTMCAFIFAFVWVLGTAQWREIDSQDPGKVLARQVFETLTVRTPWGGLNGFGKDASIDSPEERSGEVRNSSNP